MDALGQGLRVANLRALELHHDVAFQDAGLGGRRTVDHMGHPSPAFGTFGFLPELYAEKRRISGLFRERGPREDPQDQSQP